MVARQASRLRDSAVGAGAGSLEAGAPGSAKVARLDTSPERRLPMTMVPRTFVAGPRADLEDFMASPLTNDTGQSTLEPDLASCGTRGEADSVLTRLPVKPT